MATPTLTIIEGFEMQSLSNNGALWSGSPPSTCTIDTTVARTGAASLKVAMDAVTVSNVQRNVPTAATVLVGSVYFRVVSAPSVTSNVLVGLGPASNKPLFQVDTGGIIQSGIGGINGPNIADGLWHKLDFRFTSDTTHSVEWYVDGRQQTTGSIGAQTSTAMTSIQFGSANAAHTATIWFDDFILSNTSADYPLLPSAFGEVADGYSVRQIVPNADGTHNAGTNVMERQSDGADIGVVTAWDMLDEWPAVTTTSDTINQAVIGTTNYAEVSFPNTVAADKSIWGASGCLAYSAVTTTACTGSTLMSFDGFATELSVYGTSTVPVDMSETSLFFKNTPFAAPGGGWLTSTIDAATCRIGYSGDATPDPLWNAVAIQYVATDQGRGRPSPSQARQAVKRASVF